MSIPETDNAIVRYNRFDMRGTPYWGIEVANAYDAASTATRSSATAPGGDDHAISLNSGSLRTSPATTR